MTFHKCHNYIAYFVVAVAVVGFVAVVAQVAVVESVEKFVVRWIVVAFESAEVDPFISHEKRTKRTIIKLRSCFILIFTLNELPNFEHEHVCDDSVMKYGKMLDHIHHI